MAAATTTAMVILGTRVRIRQVHLRHLLRGQTVAGRAGKAWLGDRGPQDAQLKVLLMVKVVALDVLLQAVVGERDVEALDLVPLLGVALGHVQAQLGRANKSLLAVAAGMGLLLEGGLAPLAGLGGRGCKRGGGGAVVEEDVVVVVVGEGGGGRRAAAGALEHVLVEGSHVLGEGLDRDELEADGALGLAVVLQK